MISLWAEFGELPEFLGGTLHHLVRHVRLNLRHGNLLGHAGAVDLNGTPRSYELEAGLARGVMRPERAVACRLPQGAGFAGAGNQEKPCDLDSPGGTAQRLERSARVLDKPNQASVLLPGLAQRRRRVDSRRADQLNRLATFSAVSPPASTSGGCHAAEGYLNNSPVARRCRCTSPAGGTINTRRGRQPSCRQSSRYSRIGSSPRGRVQRPHHGPIAQCGEVLGRFIAVNLTHPAPASGLWRRPPGRSIDEQSDLHDLGGQGS